MNMDISSFRGVSNSSFFELGRDINYDAESKTLTKGSSSLASRVRDWVSKPDQQTVQARVNVKQAFLDALSRSEGAQNAERALSKAHLPKDWATNARPLTSRQINTVLNNAQHYRMGIVSQNEKALATILPNKTDASQRDLRSAIITAVRSHTDYGQKTLTPDDLEGIRQHATDQVRHTETEQAHARFPGLTSLMEQRQTSQSNGARPAIRPSNVVSEARQLISPDAQTAATGGAMRLLEHTSVLLGKSAWNQDDLLALDNELSDHNLELNQAQGELSAELSGLTQRHESLQTLLNELGVDPKNPPLELAAEPAELMKQLNETSERIALNDALHEDLGRQLDLVDAKQTYLEAVRLNDPLSLRAVTHSNMLWAQAGQHLIADIHAQVSSGQLEITNPQQFLGLLANAAATFNRDVVQVTKDMYAETAEKGNNFSMPAPTKENKSDHPVVTCKKDIMVELRTLLAETGLTSKQIDKLTGETSFRKAQRQALAASNTWQTLERDMLVVRDGAVQSYKSKITPAQHLDDRFKASYTVDGKIRGVTAAEAGQANHARNLKVSELFDPQGNRMAAVVGHGVLDMWKITDPQQRAKANTAGAKEVLEVALATNPRLVKTINTARQAGAPVPAPASAPRLTHVSVNLISPDNLRSTWLFNALKSDYAEKDYTRAQFAAFEANSGPGQKLQLDGGEPVSVDVDTITFSFGINGIATNPKLSTLMLGVWTNVHAHNTANMVKLIGDLGQGGFGAVGTPPGGFIGEVYDKAQAAGQTELLQKLRVQTDVVRELFTTNAFMEGRGDTAKMGREILALQTLAEQTLDAIGADDMAATMSKGCKSDKDRGGVTDVELKSKLILQDMGGDMAPDRRLVGDDQELYYTVSASSGQLENQRWNTGLGGSKEAGHLKERLPDLQVRQYLSGLGAFAAA